MCNPGSLDSGTGMSQASPQCFPFHPFPFLMSQGPAVQRADGRLGDRQCWPAWAARKHRAEIISLQSCWRNSCEILQPSQPGGLAEVKSVTDRFLLPTEVKFVTNHLLLETGQASLVSVHVSPLAVNRTNCNWAFSASKGNTGPMYLETATAQLFPKAQEHSCCCDQERVSFHTLLSTFKGWEHFKNKAKLCI